MSITATPGISASLNTPRMTSAHQFRFGMERTQQPGSGENPKAPDDMGWGEWAGQKLEDFTAWVEGSENWASGTLRSMAKGVENVVSGVLIWARDKVEKNKGWVMPYVAQGVLYFEDALQEILNQVRSMQGDDVDTRLQAFMEKVDGRTEQTSFVEENLDGLDLTSLGEKLKGLNLTNATLRGARLTGLNLQETSFAGTDLRGADFTNAQVQGANFADATFDTSEEDATKEPAVFNNTHYNNETNWGSFDPTSHAGLINDDAPSPEG